MRNGFLSIYSCFLLSTHCLYRTPSHNGPNCSIMQCLFSWNKTCPSTQILQMRKTVRISLIEVTQNLWMKQTQEITVCPLSSLKYSRKRAPGLCGFLVRQEVLTSLLNVSSYSAWLGLLYVPFVDISNCSFLSFRISFFFCIL